MSRKKGVPSLRCHVSGQSVVTFCDKNFYLGEHGSVEATARYHALLAEYIANGMAEPPAQQERQIESVVTVRVLTGEFRCHMKTRYASDPQQINRLGNLCTMLEMDYGDIPASEFGPRRLAELRELLIAEDLSRKYINRLTNNDGPTSVSNRNACSKESRR